MQLLAAVLWFPQSWWPLAVGLGGRGYRMRRLLWWGRWTPWSEVARIDVQGRWQDGSTLVRADGKKRPLVSMPPEDARRLAEALAAWRAA